MTCDARVLTTLGAEHASDITTSLPATPALLSSSVHSSRSYLLAGCTCCVHSAITKPHHRRTCGKLRLVCIFRSAVDTPGDSSCRASGVPAAETAASHRAASSSHAHCKQTSLQHISLQSKR